MFNASHSTFPNASHNSAFKDKSANRFPVNRSVRNSFNGRHISATVDKSENRFRDKSRDVIRGHVFSISENKFEYRMSILSNTTIASSCKLLPINFKKQRYRAFVVFQSRQIQSFQFLSHLNRAQFFRIACSSRISLSTRREKSSPRLSSSQA